MGYNTMRTVGSFATAPSATRNQTRKTVVWIAYHLQIVVMSAAVHLHGMAVQYGFEVLQQMRLVFVMSVAPNWMMSGNNPNPRSRLSKNLVQPLQLILPSILCLHNRRSIKSHERAFGYTISGKLLVPRATRHVPERISPTIRHLRIDAAPMIMVA
jgi:hypothetical protein